MADDRELMCWRAGTIPLETVFPSLISEEVSRQHEIEVGKAYDEGHAEGRDESKEDELREEIDTMDSALHDACRTYQSPSVKSDLWSACEYSPCRCETVVVTRWTAKVYRWIEDYWQETGEFPSLRAMADEYSSKKSWARKVYNQCYESGLLVKNKFNRPMWPSKVFILDVKESKDER